MNFVKLGHVHDDRMIQKLLRKFYKWNNKHESNLK